MFYFVNAINFRDSLLRCEALAMATNNVDSTGCLISGYKPLRTLGTVHWIRFDIIMKICVALIQEYGIAIRILTPSSLKRILNLSSLLISDSNLDCDFGTRLVKPTEPFR